MLRLMLRREVDEANGDKSLAVRVCVPEMTALVFASVQGDSS